MFRRIRVCSGQTSITLQRKPCGFLYLQGGPEINTPKDFGGPCSFAFSGDGSEENRSLVTGRRLGKEKKKWREGWGGGCLRGRMQGFGSRWQNWRVCGGLERSYNPEHGPSNYQGKGWAPRPRAVPCSWFRWSAPSVSAKEATAAGWPRVGLLFSPAALRQPRARWERESYPLL